MRIRIFRNCAGVAGASGLSILLQLYGLTHNLSFRTFLARSFAARSRSRSRTRRIEDDARASPEI